VVMERLYKRLLRKKLLDGVDKIKVGVFHRLAKRYSHYYIKEEADLLAAAVTNELFSEKPSSPRAQEFLQRNKHVVDEKLSQLRKDYEVCNVVTQAVKFKEMVSYKKRADVQQTAPPSLVRLKDLGLLVPHVPIPKSTEFLHLANEFYHQN
jgi:hypothetical protein